MTMVKARRLNKAGNEYYNQYFHPVDEVGKRDAKVNHKVSTKLLFDADYTEELDFDLHVPEKLPARKWEVAKLIYEAFGDHFEDMLHDEGVWNWLTLFYAEPVLSGDYELPGPWTLKAAEVYTVHSRSSTTSDRQYRHRLWGPAFIWSRAGDLSKVCLTKSLDGMSDMLDAVMTYNLLTPNILTTLTAMYYDEENDALTARTRPSARADGDYREGAIRDCLAQIGQIAATRAIHLLTPAQILDALPAAEFGAHIEAARVKLGLLKAAA